MEAAWKEGRPSVLVVGQDKGNVVPQRTPRPILHRTRQFLHHARTILSDHTVWRVPRRMVRADRARAVAPRPRRKRSAAPLLGAGAAAIGAGCLFLSARIFELRITLTDSSAPSGVYRLVAAPAGRGALVAACLPAAIARAGLKRGYLRQCDCPAGAEPVAKVIGALPGDVVDVERAGLRSTGRGFRTAKRRRATVLAGHSRTCHGARAVSRLARFGCSVSTTCGVGTPATSERYPR